MFDLGLLMDCHRSRKDIVENYNQEKMTVSF